MSGDALAIAAELTAKWLANPNEIHKQPPYRAHSFDRDHRFWVVGTTRVSILHGMHGDEKWATATALLFNATPAVRKILQEQTA